MRSLAGTSMRGRLRLGLHLASFGSMVLLSAAFMVIEHFGNRILVVAVTLLATAALTSLLAGRLDRMISRPFPAPHPEVQALTAELREARATLEQRVEERTRALAAATDEALEASRAKSDFLANISHELRTPMHGVLSFARLGAARAQDMDVDKRVAYFQRIHESGTQMMSLVDDLLDLGKMEAGRMTYEFQIAPIEEIVASIVDEFASVISERGLRLFTDTRWTGAVECDPRRSAQVLRNLVGNAVKFSAPGQEILITLEREGDEVLLGVLDQGPGLPEHELTVIFEKFVQSSATRSGAGGTGLGLAICREIVGAHEGRIWARNLPQGGAAFHYGLPLRQRPQSAGARSAA